MNQDEAARDQWWDGLSDSERAVWSAKARSAGADVANGRVIVDGRDVTPDAKPMCSYATSTAYPSPAHAFPAATFSDAAAEISYGLAVQAEYPGTYGICVCPARSFWLHQADVRAASSA
jgi:hypothetical protein